MCLPLHHRHQSYYLVSSLLLLVLSQGQKAIFEWSHDFCLKVVIQNLDKNFRQYFFLNLVHLGFFHKLILLLYVLLGFDLLLVLEILESLLLLVPILNCTDITYINSTYSWLERLLHWVHDILVSQLICSLAFDFDCLFTLNYNSFVGLAFVLVFN